MAIQLRDQVLEEAVLLALQSGDQAIAAQVWQWAQEQQFTPQEITIKFQVVYDKLVQASQPQPQLQPLAQLSAQPPALQLPQRSVTHSTYQPSTQPANQPTYQPDPRISFPAQLETNPEPLATPDQDSPAEMVKAVIDTYALFGIELEPGTPSALTGPRIYQLRFKPKPTAKPLISPSIEEKLVIHAALPEQGTILRPRSGFLEIQVPRKKWESWNLLDHVRGRALTATTPLVLPYGINLDCQVATFETIHALIAGMTGGGKTTFEMALITASQLWYPPDHLRLVLIDPTKAGLVQNFSDSPWLWDDIVTDPEQIPDVLDKLFLEYEARGELFAAHSLTRLEKYNQINSSRVLPRVLVFIDELFATKFPYGSHNRPTWDKDEIDKENKARSSEIDFKLTRLAQEGFKRGIHLFPSTQKPTNNAISTMIRDSMPIKVGFYVASESTGEIIFGSKEGKMAYHLQREGDMFVSCGGMHRVQGFDLSESDIHKVIAGGIRHYGAWVPPRKAAQDDLFAKKSATPRRSQLESDDPDYTRWLEYQDEYAKFRSQTKALCKVFGAKAKSGPEFYKAKETLALWESKFGGVA